MPLPGDLQAPLLIGSDTGPDKDACDSPGTPPGDSASECQQWVDEEPANMPCHEEGGCGTRGGVANLVTTAVGAGMLALPCAVSKTGILVGSLLFLLVACLTYASCSIIIRYAARCGCQTYGDLVCLHFGRPGTVVLQAAIAVHVAGVMIGYNVIIADMLVGSAPHFSGVLPTMLHRHDNPWWLSRPAVLAVLMVAVIVPTLIPRSLRAVARFSSFSVCMLFLLASAIAGLAVVAVATGHVAPDVRVLPATAAIGTSPLAVLTSLLTVVSVSALAFTCQFNLLAIEKSLKDSTCSGMLRVLVLGLSFCAVLYGTVAVSGYALFGAGTQGDVLKNLTSRFVATLVPRSLARLIVYGVALSYTLCLLANFVLKVWAVREAVTELLLQRSAAELRPSVFYASTYIHVAGAYAISVLVPSIYGLLALVGATATVVFSYVFPSLIVLKSSPGTAQRLGACLLLGLGGLMSATAIYDHLTGQGLE